MSKESPRQKTNDLEQIDSQFNQIFNASLPLRIINKDYEIVSVNDTYLNLFRLNKDEIIGIECYNHDLKHLGHRCDTDKCSMKQIEMGKDFYEYELESKLPDGTNIVNIVRSVPYKDATGNFAGIIQNFTNITERSKMEMALIESEEKYRTLVEDSIEGIWVIDGEAKTTFVNNSMANMFGYEIDEMIGKSMYAFMDDEGIKAAENKFESRKDGIKEDHEFVFFHKSGKKVYTYLRTTPILGENGTFNGALAFVTDITQQKIAQEKIADMAKFPFENPNPVLRLSKSYILLANKAAQKLFNIDEG
ncbi:MAG: PAS domain-containing protein, partial [Promethearchaeota archaeon]